MLSRRDARKMKVVPVKLRQGDLTIPVEFGEMQYLRMWEYRDRGPWSIPLFNPSMSDKRYRLASSRLLTARRAHLYCAARARGVPVRRVCVSLWRLRPLRGRPYRQVSCSQ